MPPVYSVSEITKKIKKLLSPIGWVWVQGEVSNLNYHSSGHIYFSLKDEESKINAVIFRSSARNLKHKLKEGQEFQIYGRIDIWKKGSQYQIIAEKIIPGKIGYFFQKFQEIKEKLEKEGLFAEEKKKEIPEYPERIGVITSGDGAAIKDVLRIVKKRSPKITVIVRPTLVQGEPAPSDIIMAIKEFNQYKKVDLIILTRGGGSIEDLWCFNDEGVAHAIFESIIPIISAVGHERDFSISDFVADRRAATPTEAAEIAVPDKKTLLREVTHRGETIIKIMNRKRESLKHSIESLEKSYALKKPKSIIEMKQQNIDHLNDRLIQFTRRRTQQVRERMSRLTISAPELSSFKMKVNNSGKELINYTKNNIKDTGHRIKTLEKTLQATSPEKTLARGYSIVRKDSEIIKDSKKLKKEDIINIKFYKGKGKARIEETN